MKVLLCFLVTLVTFASAISQTVSFEYDDSGNREERNIIPLNSVFQSKSKIETEDKKPFVDNIGSDVISIYPNPVSMYLNVNIQSEKDILEIIVHVIDQSGHTIISEKYQENDFQLDFSHLSAGIYYMIIQIGEDKTNWKIIKE